MLFSYQVLNWLFLKSLFMHGYLQACSNCLEKADFETGQQNIFSALPRERPACRERKGKLWRAGRPNRRVWSRNKSPVGGVSSGGSLRQLPLPEPRGTSAAAGAVAGTRPTVTPTATANRGLSGRAQPGPAQPEDCLPGSTPARHSLALWGKCR